MAKKSPEMEVEKESGGMGRFLFIATPILFTLVLVGVIVMLFNVDLRNSMFSTLDKIPIVKNWVPSADKGSSTTASTTQSESDSATVDKLKKELAASKATQEEQAKEIDTLKKNATTNTNGTSTTPATTGTTPATTGTTTGTGTTSTGTSTLNDYQKQVKNVAKIYSNMSSSKAAAILQNMTTPQQVEILNAMNATDQAGILQKMDAKVASVTSLALQNATTTVAPTPASSTTSSKLDDQALAQTFTSMPAASAADLLLQTAKGSQAKVLKVLNTMDDTTRAGILSAMSTKDPAATVKIINQLMSSN
ncbi:magnesium transporter MgtE N-terminal domain-containing protein [Paenibacillus nicotianae]|uniref:Magnesium transporter MgtE N-terminal domain-containing protein n=1 Tax=Paenibacillus nicotianae TaxID=1526551 RepID=A0ABW4UXQ0_9BACL